MAARLCQYVLGIDVGTTGTKAMLVDEKGKIAAASYKGYSLKKYGSSCVEQSAEDWWEAFVETVRECTRGIKEKECIRAISVSSQGGSLVPVDGDGIPKGNALVWMDNRGCSQRIKLLIAHPDEFYYKKTGWKLNTGLNLVKIKWLQENNKETFDSTYKFLSTLDYINYKLTGRYVIDPTNGAMTQLMDIDEGWWDDRLLTLAGISREKLPEILPSGCNLGKLAGDAADALGLCSSTIIVNGGHDQYCAAVGAGAVDKGDILLSTGTAWVVLGIADKRVFDNKSYAAPGRHIIDGLWGLLASIPTGGVAMEWFRDNFALKVRNDHRYDSESFNCIDEKAGSLMEKDQGLFFYPYYNGSGFPAWNSKMKASLLGMGLEHDRYDIARAIMEGVAFEVNCILEEYKAMGNRVENLRILGGASRSNLWTDIIANVVDCSIIRFNEADIACAGAAIIAGVGYGMFTGYKDSSCRLSGSETFYSEDSIKKSFYKEKYARYKKGIGYIENYYSNVF